MPVPLVTVHETSKSNANKCLHICCKYAIIQSIRFGEGNYNRVQNKAVQNQ